MGKQSPTQALTPAIRGDVNRIELTRDVWVGISRWSDCGKGIHSRLGADHPYLVLARRRSRNMRPPKLAALGKLLAELVKVLIRKLSAIRDLPASNVQGRNRVRILRHGSAYKCFHNSGAT